MKQSNTDQLINQLTAQLRPVKIIRFSSRDFFKVFFAGLISLSSAIFILGLRADFSDQTLSSRFVVESVLLVLLGIASILATITLSVPSLVAKKIYKPLLVLCFLALSTFISSFLTSPDPFIFSGYGLSCVIEIMAIGLLPAITLFYLIRPAAPLQREVVGALAAISGISFGLFAAQITCIDSTPLHILFWHIIPAFIFIYLGALVSKKIISAI